jgi:hypothetical protein
MAWPAQLVKEADHRGFDHLVMGHQDAFDIERPDPVARHDDHVVVARREEVVPVRVDVYGVAGQPQRPSGVKRPVVSVLPWYPVR